MKISDEQLTAEHTHEAISERIENNQLHGALGDLVLGGVDGAITTFAIVSGVAGTGMSGGVLVAFVLGVANVIADGFSMGVSNYLKARSDQQNVERFRKIEEIHIDRVPEAEKEEVRQIFQKKGFSGEVLEEIVQVITKDRELWINTMLSDEWGLQTSPTSPIRSGVLTFTAFLLAGIVPLLPLLLGFGELATPREIFQLSAICTAGTFLVMGAIRGKVMHQSPTKSALETLLVGGTAAALAYFTGNLLAELIQA